MCQVLCVNKLWGVENAFTEDEGGPCKGKGREGIDCGGVMQLVVMRDKLTD